MPARLRPTAPIAAAALLVGDPGRALMLAQELLEAPKMSNHARGLWGYTGATPTGEPLTIQATGMGGPSAAVVLADLAELGVRKAVRVGTAAAVGAAVRPGEMLLVDEAHAWGPGDGEGRAIRPEPGLTVELERRLGQRARRAAIVSLDTLPRPGEDPPHGIAADMQTATLLVRAGELALATAVVLVVTESAGTAPLADEELAELAKLAGRAGREALLAYHNPQVEG
ncbi:MAG TPA: hypothetical protein VFN82_03815 [Solirubrobacterales bacterium]|nr:hypothetical protein [Solirubrobacterales bacterium]